MIQQIKALCRLALLFCTLGAFAYGSDPAVQQGATINLGPMPHTPWLSITSISGNGNSASDHGSFSGTSLSGASIDITNHLNQAVYVSFSFGSSAIPSQPYCSIESSQSQNRFSSCGYESVNSGSYTLYVSKSDQDFKALDTMTLSPSCRNIELKGSLGNQYLKIATSAALNLSISGSGIDCTA